MTELKLDEQRHARTLSNIMDSRHDSLQHQLHEFKKDALAEVEALRYGVNTIGHASGLLNPSAPSGSSVSPDGSRWQGNRVSWSP